MGPFDRRPCPDRLRASSGLVLLAQLPKGRCVAAEVPRVYVRGRRSCRLIEEAPRPRRVSPVPNEPTAIGLDQVSQDAEERRLSAAGGSDARRPGSASQRQRDPSQDLDPSARRREADEDLLDPQNRFALGHALAPGFIAQRRLHLERRRARLPAGSADHSGGTGDGCRVLTPRGGACTLMSSYRII
jgi:hypothetical protein